MIKADFEYYFDDRRVTVRCQCSDLGYDWIKKFSYVIMENDEEVEIIMTEDERYDLETECFEVLSEMKGLQETGRGYDD